MKDLMKIDVTINSKDQVTILVDGKSPIGNPQLAEKCIHRIIDTINPQYLSRDSSIETFIHDLLSWIEVNNECEENNYFKQIYII